MSLNLNQLPTDPELKDVLDLHRKAVFLSLNCHHIGTIKSFNPAKQTAEITINYTRTYNQGQATGAATPKQVSYPVMVDVPVICLGGAGGALTFPIAAGDECVVLFNDRDMDNWFTGSSNSQVNTPRAHSFSDGIALVGVRSLAKVLQGYSPTNVELQNGGNKISIGVQGDDIVLTVPGPHSLTVTFRATGGMAVQNSIGNFIFEDNADISFNTGTVTGLFGSGGHVSFTNATGELIVSLYNLGVAIQAATVGGIPIVLPPSYAVALAIIQSFAL